MNTLLVIDLPLHHAYAIKGEKDAVFSALQTFLKKKVGIPIRANPDILFGDYTTMGVEDSRLLSLWAIGRPVLGTRKIFIGRMVDITAPAQNALLKLLEEPGGSSHFFLILPTFERLIPTLISRLVLLDADMASEANDSALFLEKTYPDRMFFIKKLIEDITLERKTKADVLVFLSGLERDIRGKSPDARVLSNILYAKREMLRPGASLKMLLELIALSLPKAESLR